MEHTRKEKKMDKIKKHLLHFPKRIKDALEGYEGWERICEIRLRAGLPLSLTSYDGNILIDEEGKPCQFSRALCCTEKEMTEILSAFCGGSVYRYFDTLKEGFAVDDDGWRLGLCSSKGSAKNFLPETVEGMNLRIPRSVPYAALPLVKTLSEEGLDSFLILSKPGDGKTTLIRSLAFLLSKGEGLDKAVRVAVVDERREIFPKKFSENMGLIDVLSGYEKKEGIEMATRLFSPQVILCDEIGNEEEAKALLSSCSGGCRVIATAHAKDLAEARRIPYLDMLFRSGRFEKAVFIQRIVENEYKSVLRWEKVS